MEGVANLRSQRRLFVATICAGSFLLFLVQPMIARMALPRLGGAPTVWNSAMLVYQALLLVGYGYAHWLGARPPQVQRWLHIALFALAAVMLPIGLMAGEMPADANPLVWVPWLLLGSIGPLFLIVSAQAPLMQRWFALSGGDDPYPLYAASNLGSFAGLISYPLLVEPLLPVAQQSLLWSVGYGVLMVLVFLCGQKLTAAHLAPEHQAAVDHAPPPTPTTMLRWTALAAIPSGLMLSTSLHLTTDIVAMPLLWVLPLGLYLLSFSVAFADNQKFANLCARLAPLFLLIAACGTFVDTSRWALLFALVTLINLFLVAVALHNAMFATRPAPEHLTRFYFIMSLGGVIGGIFCALIAPLIFNWSFEHPLLLVAAAVAMKRPPIFEWAARRVSGARNATVLLVVVLALSYVGLVPFLGLPQSLRDGLAAVLILLLAIGAIGRRIVFAGCVSAVMLSLGGWEKISNAYEEGRITRSYFGIYSIYDYPDGARGLVHGTTLHGIQNQKAGKQTIPTTYYAPSSGVGLAMSAVPALFGPNANISVIGLGTGTLACYAKPGQHWRIFEIDPAIAKIARDPKRFSFLSRCAPDARIMIGDARLVVARQAPGQAHVLAVDAFSSDAVPMHLLTREAFAIYGRYLRKDGLLMVHISNRFLNLRPVVAAAAAKGGWQARVDFYLPNKAGFALNYSPSDWIALSRDAGTLEKLAKSSPPNVWQPLEANAGDSGWSDDYASILPIIRWPWM
jgi:hypothetical protein